MTKPTLTNCQKGVLIEIIRCLEQLSDRQQMRADAYLAKYHNPKAPEDNCLDLRWAVEREFPDVKA